MKNLTLESYFYNEIQRELSIHWTASNCLEGVFKEEKITLKYERDVFIDDAIIHFIFASVVIPCYAIIHKNYNISIYSHLRSPMHESVFKEICLYHNIKNVIYKSNVTNDRPATIPVSDKVGLFYGGGKDSLVSAAIQGEIFGEEKINLLRLVWDEDINNLEKKSNIINESLEFMSGKGFSSAKVISDFHFKVINRSVGKIPGLALYSAFMAPIFVKENYRLLSFGYDSTEFHNSVSKNRAIPFRNSRPNIISHLSNAIFMSTGLAINFKNFNYSITPYVAFKLLSCRYNDYYSNLYMCERLAGKWCLKCRKCITYAFACLANKQPCDFNLKYFFEKSKYVNDLALETVDKSVNELNGLHIDKFSHPKHFCATVELVNDIDLDYAKKELLDLKYPRAYYNFIVIALRYRHLKYEDHSSFWLAAYEQESQHLNNDPDNKIKNSLLNILKESNIKIIENKKITGLNRDVEVYYDYN
ncbi:hypothetical protein ACNPAA_17725 [Aeromonas sp. PS2Canimalfood6]|uniref:hypothetical protein n=1 Tax=Aeromonas sp. PS2Canimalfood6 TaxID=3397770 RepID=UPI003AA7BE77